MRRGGGCAEEVWQLRRNVPETRGDERVERTVATVAIVVVERRIPEEESRVAAVRASQPRIQTCLHTRRIRIAVLVEVGRYVARRREVVQASWHAGTRCVLHHCREHCVERSR